MIVVSNTTPLIGLAQIQRFDLLEELSSEIYIHQAVYEESVVGGQRGVDTRRSRICRVRKMRKNGGNQCHQMK